MVDGASAGVWRGAAGGFYGYFGAAGGGFVDAGEDAERGLCLTRISWCVGTDIRLKIWRSGHG